MIEDSAFHDDIPGIRVAGDIGEGFLEDSESGGFDFSGNGILHGGDSEFAGNAGESGELRGFLADGGGEAEVVECCRPESGGDAADRIDAIIDHGGGFHEVVDVRVHRPVVQGGEAVFDEADAHFQAG